MLGPRGQTPDEILFHRRIRDSNGPDGHHLTVNRGIGFSLHDAHDLCGMLDVTLGGWRLIDHRGLPQPWFGTYRKGTQVRTSPYLNAASKGASSDAKSRSSGVNQ